jgi:predicted dehydrogenase
MVKVGLIGCGFMGTVHATCYRYLENVKVVGVSDLRKEYAKKAADITKSEIFSDPMELIQCKEVEVIDICLPTYLHKKFILACCDAKKNVFCEKPLTLNEQDAEEIVMGIKESKVKFMIGMVLRFWPEYMEFKKIVDSGKFGKLKVLQCTRLSTPPLYGWDNWYLDPIRSGGAALDLHIHDVDFIYYLFGKPESVYSTGRHNSKNGLEHICSIYKYKDRIVNAEAGWDLSKSFGFMQEIRGVFEDGTVLIYNSKNQPLTVFQEENSELVKINKKEMDSLNSGGNISDILGYYNEIKYWVDCLQDNRKPERVTIEDAKTSLEIVLAEIKSAKNEQEIVL